MDLTLVVLAAGLATRYGAIKQLEPVGPSGEALMDYAIFDAVQAGFTRVVLVIRRELELDFLEHVGHRFGRSLDVSLVFQALEDLPAGFSVPAERVKPWGTAHAVLTAASVLHEPFVVMNADDFYGATAFERLGEHLRSAAGREGAEFAAAGYALKDTLSPFGGVSRAICEVDEDGFLQRVTEVKNIRGEDGDIAGVTLTGERLRLTGDETISMNLWAATPAALPLLRWRFERFLSEHGNDPEAEFLLSTAVNELIGEGEIRVRVIPTPGAWLGVTYQQDRSYAAEKLRQLVRDSRYPEDLSVWFRDRQPPVL